LLKIVKKLPKSGQKVRQKIEKRMDKIALAENYVTVRRRGIEGRRFVVPRPGATLSHLVKTK
jgi:hypothetical protein